MVLTTRHLGAYNMFLFKKKPNLAVRNHQFNFKNVYTLEERRAKLSLVDSKYVGERSRGISYLVVQQASNSHIPTFKKAYKLFAIDNSMRIIDLIAYIRNNLKLSEKQSIFLIIGKTIANSNYTIGELYQSYKQPDGFLYVTVSESEVFGSVGELAFSVGV